MDKNKQDMTEWQARQRAFDAKVRAECSLEIGHIIYGYLPKDQPKHVSLKLWNSLNQDRENLI